MRHQNHKKTAALITAFLILLCAVSLFYILSPTAGNNGEQYIADIFQNGVLIMSVPLTDTPPSDSLLIEGENGCTNEIAFRPGSIGIISADCPDKLCVRQGFIRDSRLPITCLPNRLVIQLRPLSGSAEDSFLPDAVTY